MVGELPEIAGFVQTCPPFDGMGSDALLKLVRSLSVGYHKSGDRIELTDDSDFYLIRSGSVEIRNADDQRLSAVSP